MKFDSLSFFLFIFFSLVVFHAVRRSPFRPLVLAGINAIFLCSFTSTLAQLWPLLFFILLGYVFIHIVQRAHSAVYLGLFVGLIILLFIYFKRYTAIDFLPPISSPYVVIGLSYILFRVIHLLIDAHDKAVPGKISFLNYFNFTCFFLNLVSGPIQRYQDFIKQDQSVQEVKLKPEEVYRAFSRITTGYIKIIFLAPFFFQIPHPQYLNYAYVLGKLNGQGALILSGWFVFAVLSFIFKLYMNFSGYMDVVIGIGKLFHYNLPENFDRPFSSANFLEFWRRWHITLAEWFKTYLFNPILKAMMHRFHSPLLVPYLGAFAYFMTFFVMGVWHGTTAMFFIYGLFLGVGVGVNKFYQVIMTKSLGKAQYQSLCAQPVYRQFSRGFACSYFCIALTALWMDLGQFMGLFGRSSWIVLVLGFGGIGIFLTGFLFVWDGLLEGLGFARNHLRYFMESFFAKQLWLAVKVILISYLILANINPAPVFVYQAF